MKIKLLALIALALILAASQPASADDKRTPVVIDGMKELPLRVLTKPYAKIYQKPEEGSPTVQENLSAFQPFYVYSRPGEESLAVDQGWYEVGVTPTGKVVGWMKSLDVFEWRQTMCLAYTHPDGRKPVLMFEQKKPLLDLINAQPPQRSAKANEYYNTIGSGQVPPDFPVESVEPKKAVDISKQFYLLPILQHEAIEIDGREGRLLRLAAVTGAGPKAREASDIRKNQDFLNKSNENATLANSDVMKDLKVDLVFVIDTTRSMAPYIKATLDMVRDVTKSLSEFRDVQASMHMGLWGYRDSMEDIPQIGYTTKNFTPQLQPVDQFEQILSQMQVTMVDSRDWAEDVFSGVNDAISMTAWNEDSIRIMVLMGDAAGHDAGHKRNLSGHTPDTPAGNRPGSQGAYLRGAHQAGKGPAISCPGRGAVQSPQPEPGCQRSHIRGCQLQRCEGVQSRARHHHHGGDAPGGPGHQPARQSGRPAQKHQRGPEPQAPPGAHSGRPPAGARTG
jgi:serine/threonine-protein kinase PpkA